MTTDKTTQEIAARVKQLRYDRGWTQEILAKKVGLQRSALNQKESGNRNIHADEIVRLADAFGLTTDELIRGIRPEQLDIHEDVGLSSKAICTLQEFKTRYPEYIPDLNTLLSSPNLLHLITTYMNLPQGNGPYLPPEKVTRREDGQYEMKLTPASLKIVLESSIIREMREIHEE